MRRRLFPIQLALVSVLIAACVTINVYFPAAAAEKAADKIIEDVWGKTEGEAPKAQPSDKTTSRTQPQAQRMLKYAFNLLDDGLVGQQLFAGEATRLAYMTDEAVEGRDQFLEKRPPDWSRFPWYY